MRSIPALAKTSISTSEIRFFAILSPIFNKYYQLSEILKTIYIILDIFVV